MHKIVAAEGRVALHHLTRQGGLTAEQWTRVEARPPVSGPWACASTAPTAPRCATSGPRPFTASTPTAWTILVVDYLQLVRSSTTTNATREQAVAAISAARPQEPLRGQLGLPAYRYPSSQRRRADARVRAIKNDASVVIKGRAPRHGQPESPRAGEVDLVIDKNRFRPRHDHRRSPDALQP